MLLQGVSERVEHLFRVYLSLGDSASMPCFAKLKDLWLLHSQLSILQSNKIVVTRAVSVRIAIPLNER